MAVIAAGESAIGIVVLADIADFANHASFNGSGSNRMGGGSNGMELRFGNHFRSVPRSSQSQLISPPAVRIRAEIDSPTWAANCSGERLLIRIVCFPGPMRASMMWVRWLSSHAVPDLT